MTDGKSIKEQREYFIVKGNELVRYAKYKYTAQQLKIFNYAVSKIKRNDKQGTWYELSIEELCRICGLNIDTSGTYYRNIKADLSKLTERRWVTLPDREMTISALSDAQIIPLSGTVYVKFHEFIEPYLFDQLEKYTQYKLSEILCFHSKYSIRLYEVLKSYITAEDIDNEKEIEHCFTIDELREVLAVDGYKIWGEFERNVLKVAAKEINEHSSTLQVSYDVLKRGKIVVKVNFIITAKRPVQSYITRQTAKQQLDGNASRERKRNAEKTVKGWIQVHPKGTKRECIEETGLSKYLVNKYWSEEAEKKIQGLKMRISDNNKKIADMRATHEHLQKKYDELKKLLTEDAPEMAKELLTRIMAATGAERDAAQAEYDEFMGNLKTISETWTEIAPEIESTMQEILAKAKSQAQKVSKRRE